MPLGWVYVLDTLLESQYGGTFITAFFMERKKPQASLITTGVDYNVMRMNCH